MAGKTQKYNASINFGASVDNSMTRALTRMTSDIDDIGKVSLKTMGVQTAWMRQASAGSASTANKIKTMEQATTALLKKQEALEKQIKDGVKAGDNVKSLVTDYQRVSSGINQATKELEKLNAEQIKEGKIAEERQRAEEKHQRKWDRLERVSRMPGGAINKGASIAWSGAKTGVMAAVGTAVALPATIVGLNKKTAEEAALAKSYGLSYERYKAGSIVAEQAGLNGENVGDLAEELVNKTGDTSNAKTLNPMLAQIGLTKSMLVGKPRQEQFDTVLERITSGVKSGKISATQGESVADQLMGGEANKLVTYITGLNKTYSEVMSGASQLNMVTNAEAEGAVQSSRVLDNLWISAETAFQGAAGEIGTAFQPTLQKMETEAIAWIRENKDAIAKSIGDWATGGGPKRLVDGLELFGEEVVAVGEKLKWLLPDTSKMSKDQQTITDYLSMGNSIEGGKSLAKDYDLEDWFADQHFDDPDKMDSMRQDWKLHHTPIAPGMDVAGESIPFTQKQPTQQTNHVTITVNAAEGQSAEDIGQNIYEQFQNAVPSAGFGMSGSSTFDTPQT